ncbi:hypothetical protein ABPG74_010123 [Tetrahymena malaccensis]
MLIQKNTQNLWIADSNYIYLFEIQNPFNGKQKKLAQIQKQTNAGTTFAFKNYLDCSRIFIVNKSGVHVYDIADLNNISFIFAIPSQQTTRSISIDPSINVISLVDSTLRIIQMINPSQYYSSNIQLQVKDVCSIPLLTTPNLNQIVLSQFLLIQTNEQVIAGADLQTFLKTGNCADIHLVTLFTSIDTYLEAVVSQDSKYVIISINYLYIQIIELSYNPLSAQLFQQIDVFNYFFQFMISSDSQLIFVSTLDNIEIYQIKKTNFNQIIPSIINFPQINVYDKFLSSLQYPFSCQFTQFKKYLLSAKGTEGAYIFQEDPNSHVLFQVQNINPPNFSTNLKLAKVFNNDNNLIIGRDNILFIYDISNINNPQQLSQISIAVGNQIRSAYITKDSKYIIMAGDSLGIVIIDISNLVSPTIIATKYQDYPISSKCQNVLMDHAEKYIFASYNGQGLVIYDVSQIKSPIILSYVITYGGQNQAIFFTKNYLVFADGQFGIKIIDINSPSNPQIVSALRIQGSAKDCALIFNENFLLCTARYRGQLQLIDLRDITNPYILQVFNYQNFDGGLNVCVNSDQTVAYLGLINSIIRINLFPSVLLDIDILLIDQGGTQQNTFLDIGTTLKVGQTINIIISQVYPANQAYINQVYYYSNYQMQDLPYWATFSQAESSLILKLDQSAILQDSNVQCNSDQAQNTDTCQNGNTQQSQLYKTSQQFIFSISQKLSNTDFMNNNLNINMQMSQQIFIDCILANLVTHDYFVSQTSQIVVNYLLQSKYQQNIIDYIYYILSQRNTYYPINFEVQSSLQVHIEDDNDLPTITTINNQIEVQFYVNKSQACFIPYQYSGVLIYLSAQNDWMKIQGDSDSINTIIQQGIRIANYVDPKQIQVTIVINDSINFVVTKVIYADHKYLIKLNKPIQNNPSLSLKDDFNQKFSSSQIYILDSFSYTINPMVFLNPDNRPLKFTAKIQINNIFTDIPQQFWLVFSEEQRNFFGTTTSSQYRQVARIMINATDGYTYAVDQFEIHIDLIPISYILSYLFQILSPIIGILGLWKYRSNMYNRFSEQSYKTTTIQIESGEEITFQIPLLGKNLKEAQELWKNYFKQLNKQQVMQELNSKNNQSYIDQSQIQISKEKIMICSTVKCSPSSRLNQEVFLRRQSLFQKKYMNNITKSFEKNKSKISQSQIHEQRVSMMVMNKNNFYFNGDKSLNRKNILNDIIQYYKLQKIKSQDQSIEIQLSNPQSMISRIIIGLAAVQFSQLDKTSLYLINYLKNIAIDEGYLEVDWYKKYVFIVAQPQNIHKEQFPIILFQEAVLNKELDQIFQKLCENEQKNNQFKQIIPFVKEVIEAIALGFNLEGKKLIAKIRGESLEVEYLDIKCIRSYRPIKQNGIFSCKKPSEVLVEKEFHQNQELPSWVKSLDITNQVILIQGITENKDIGEYVLNLQNKQNFIIKQIRILIVPSQQKEEIEDEKKDAFNSQGATLLQCLEPPFDYCSVIFSMQCGLQFSCLDILSQNVILYNFPAQIQVQQMYIQSNTQYLWVADANKLYLFEIQNPKQSLVANKFQIPKQQNAGATNSFSYYQDTNRLFVVNNSGVDVYDIQNVEKINYIFTIPAKSSTLLTISFSINIAFLADTSLRLIQFNNIQDYQTSKTNYNQIIPSVVNIPQIAVYDKFTSVLQYAYSCQYTPVQNYLLSAKGTEGVYFLQEDPNSHTLFQVQNINPPNFTTNLKLAKVFNNDNNLVIGRDNHIYFYDISHIKNPKQISTLSISSGNQIRSAYITKDLKNMIVAGDSQGIVIVDISNLSTPQIIASKYQDLPISSKCQDLSMDVTEKYIYASYAGQGLVIYDSHNFTSPIILSYITTYGGQNIRVFQTKQLIVFADAQFGLKIIDVSQPASPFILSSLRTQGSTKECSIIYNELFLLCTARYRGQIQLIDLRDAKNPNILQVFNYQNIDGGLNICVNSDKRVAYLGLINSVIRLNLFPSVNFDLDIQLISEGNNKMNTILKIGTIFKVGQQIKINLNQVYPSNQAFINKIFYYSDFNMQDLPYWASYSQSSSSLILQLDKNSLLSSSSNKQNSNQTSSSSSSQNGNQIQISQQQFVFSVSQKLSNTDFININLNITQQLSQQIFNDCLLTNLITHDYYVIQSSQEVIKNLLQNKYQQNMIDYIYYILSLKNNYYPINFLVESSLQVNIDDENVAPQIQTISSQILISLEIDSSQGCFIPYQYSGVLIYLNADNSKIQLQGDVASINSIINDGIRIANYIQPQYIQLTININDQINYVVTKTISATHKYLIKLNQPISNNPSLSLRDDFALKFSNSQLYILESFSYTFNPQIFLNPDGRALHYTAKIYINNEYEVIPQQYWLVFQQEQRNFFGQVSSSQFKKVSKIMINATDGYTYAIDYFEMHFDLIPFSYILLYTFQIMSPIIGILGLWKYKSLMYNNFRKKNYRTTKIQINSGDQIVMQIPLLGKKLEIAQNLWESYFKKLNKAQVLKELNQILEKKDIENVCISQSNEDMAASTIKYTPNLRKRNQTFQQISNKFSKIYLRSISKVSQNKDIIKSQVEYSRKSTLSNVYFNNDGSLNTQFILEAVSLNYQQNFKEKDVNIEAQLRNSKSMISRAVAGLAAVQLSQLCHITKQILDFLKNISLQEGYLEVDWYKKYVQIIPQPQNIHQDQFPIIQFLENTFSQIFQDTFQNYEDKDEKKKQSLQIIPFIKQVIEAIALGFTLDGKGMVPKIRGECIETEYHDIKSIRSYRPISREIYCCVKFDYEELVEKEFHQNQELPSWIQSLDITNQVILIQGKAENKDIGEYVLNLINKKNFIVKQIRLQINRLSDYQQNQTTNQCVNIKTTQMNKSQSQLIPMEESVNQKYFLNPKLVKSSSNSLSLNQSPQNKFFMKTIFRDDSLPDYNTNYYNEKIEQDQIIQL